MRTSDFMAGGSFAPRAAAPSLSGQTDAEGGTVIGPQDSGPTELLRRLRESPALSEFATPRRDLPLLRFEIPRLDALLAGGLRRDALHEIRSSLSRDNGAATGFAAAILARLAGIDARPVLWVVEASSVGEAGALYGAGLERLGLDPQRLIVVTVRKPVDALWVAEEGLACRGLSAVVAEIKGAPRLLDLTATRRLALRARSGVMGILLRQSDTAEPSAATTRWRTEPLPATTLGDYAAGIGFPAWRLVLERNRRGTAGAIDVEWDHGRRSLAAIAGGLTEATHPVALPAVSVDRPPPPPDAGKIVALPLPLPWKESAREIRRRITRAR